MGVCIVLESDGRTTLPDQNILKLNENEVIL